MQFREYPMLNTPNLITVILRAAAAGDASVEDCAGRLRSLLAQAGEAPAVPPEKIRRRLAGLARDLTIARLLAPVGEDRFALTGRGRAALAASPMGFATDDLMVYPEYAEHVRAGAPRRDGMDPHAPAYDAGFYARAQGRSAADNPYPADSADHLAWENGWGEALDEGLG